MSEKIFNLYVEAGKPYGETDSDRVIRWAGEEIERLKAELAEAHDAIHSKMPVALCDENERLRYALLIYAHAYRTDNRPSDEAQKIAAQLHGNGEGR